MAEPVPLNQFKLIATGLSSGSNLIYQETTRNISSIILSSQVSNLTGVDQTVSVKIQKS
jgi:hypothetical protein